MEERDFDVVVVGAGPAGTVAAIQAGRAGARTLLVEKTGMLGGMTTTGGVSFPGVFHAWGRQVIAGIGWELVSRCVAECGGQLPDFSVIPARHTEHHVHINRAVYAALCDEAVLGAGVKLTLHTMAAVVAADEDPKRITLCTKTGLVTVTAKVLLDCTGDANAASLAGCGIVIPPECQPATLMYAVSGYDAALLDMVAIEAAFEEEVHRGNVKRTDAGWDLYQNQIRHWFQVHGSNANHVGGINARDSEGKTQLEVEARRSLLRLFRFLRRQPGTGNVTFQFVAPECGVRETAVIVGKKTVTLADYTTGRRWEDAVCNSYYPIDLHKEDNGGLDLRPLERGIVPCIPRGAMLPANTRNFIVAGRCISSDRLANSALRVQPSCMAMGQAAGAMAALAARTGVEVESLPISDIHCLLREHKAIVPGEP